MVSNGPSVCDVTSELAPSLRDFDGWRSADLCVVPNAMTCDVEDYFQVSAFEHLVPKGRWAEFESRIPRNVDRILELLADAGAKATFFTLGWVAQCLPEVVRRVASQGHEIASHGMHHVRVWSQTRDEFREDARTAKQLLEQASGMRVRGYRAASWSIDKRTPWAHEVLGEVGYEYSSSIYPIAHDHYGVPDALTTPHYVGSSGVLEIPASTVALVSRNWPAAGGGFFRLLPLKVSFWMINRVRSSRGVPAMFYFHPWEIDPDQPRMSGAGQRARFRHYVNLKRFEPRFRRLLSSFSWDRMDRIFCPPTEPRAHER